MLRGITTFQVLRNTRGTWFSKKPFSSFVPAVHSQDIGEIEIERKFRVTDSIIAYCENHATHKTYVEFTDTYYDNTSYDLTRKDMWLRERNGKWELKLPALVSLPSFEPKTSNQLIGLDFYNEITHHSTIAQKVQSAINSSSFTYDDTTSQRLNETVHCADELVKWLQIQDIKSFGRIKTSRTRYSVTIPIEGTPPSSSRISQNAYIDIDDVTYDPRYCSPSTNHTVFKYRIGEIELAPPFSVKDRNEVMRWIFRTLQIDIRPVRGKLLEYLKVFRPHHYETLEKCGQLASKGISAETIASPK